MTKNLVGASMSDVAVSDTIAQKGASMTHGAANEQENQKVSASLIAMVAVLLGGAFLGALNQNLINTALPVLMQAFSVSTTQVQWLITAYTLANGVMIPVTAYLVGRFSTKTMYFTAMLLFLAGTALAAMANSFALLLIGRILQALGAGLNMTLIQTVLFTTFPENRRGTAMGFVGLVIAFAPAFGPSVAGVIVDALPWQALFVIQIPISVVLMILAVFLVKNVTGGTKGSLDVLSVVLSTIGFGGVLYGFGMVGELGFANPIVIGAIVVGIAGIVWFVTRQLRLKVPVLNFRTFTYRGFTSSLVLTVGTWCLFISMAAVLPLYMQNMLGFSATQSGMALMAGGIAMGVLNPVMGRVYDRYGAWVCVMPGMILELVALVMFAFVSSDTSMAYIVIAYTVFLVGLALCNTALTTRAIGSLPAWLIAHGSAMNNTLRQVMAAIATAVFVSLMIAVAGPGASGAEQISGVRTVFTIMAILAAVMLCVAAKTIKRRE